MSSFGSAVIDVGASTMTDVAASHRLRSSAAARSPRWGWKQSGPSERRGRWQRGQYEETSGIVILSKEADGRVKHIKISWRAIRAALGRKDLNE
jgi:hypothetical protein